MDNYFYADYSFEHDRDFVQEALYSARTASPDVSQTSEQPVCQDSPEAK